MNNIPSVSVLISAYNEESNIANLLNDLLSQVGNDYLLDSISVLSDGSTDNTCKVVKSIKSEQIHLIEKKIRKGKASGIND